MDCNNCKYLNITEKEQTDKKENHICLKYNQKVFHTSFILKGKERKLYPCWGCRNDNYANFATRIS